MNLEHLQKIVALKDATGHCIRLNTAYIDSTFLSTAYSEFPTQFESIAIITELIEGWLSKGPNYKISLRTSARYGYEILFKAIYDRFLEPIHVNDSQIQKYKFIPELDKCFTTNATISRIHACFSATNKNQLKLPCDPEVDTQFIRVIKPSAMIWRNWKKYCSLHRSDANSQYIRVCYSNHSSFCEIKDLLMYLRPMSVQLNVVPDDVHARTKMIKCVDEIMRTAHPPEIITYTNKELNINELKLNKIKFRRVDKKNVIAQEDNDDAGDLANIIVKRRIVT